MSKRVAIYTRVATYATEDRLLQQLEACREFAQKRAWRVVAEVTDRGVSEVSVTVNSYPIQNLEKLYPLTHLNNSYSIRQAKVTIACRSA
jgi:hypothetical protein